METIQQYYAICSLTIKRLPLVAPYLETVARETVLENIPFFPIMSSIYQMIVFKLKINKDDFKK